LWVVKKAKAHKTHGRARAAAGGWDLPERRNTLALLICAAAHGMMIHDQI
jgi:hypothetical protein